MTPEEQYTYVDKFITLTGHKPVGEVRMSFRVISRKYIMAGLEAQVTFKGADGEDYLKTVFTAVKRYQRDNNKFVPDHNQRKPDGQTEEAERDAGAPEEQSGAGDAPRGLPAVPVHVDVQPQATQDDGGSVGEEVPPANEVTP